MGIDELLSHFKQAHHYELKSEFSSHKKKLLYGSFSEGECHIPIDGETAIDGKDKVASIVKGNGRIGYAIKDLPKPHKRSKPIFDDY